MNNEKFSSFSQSMGSLNHSNYNFTKQKEMTNHKVPQNENNKLWCVRVWALVQTWMISVYLYRPDSMQNQQQHLVMQLRDLSSLGGICDLVKVKKTCSNVV